MTTTDDTSWLEGEQRATVAAAVPVIAMSKRELSLALAWPVKRIDKAIRDGLPCYATGSNRAGLRFDLPKVIEWLVGQAAGDDTNSAAEAKRLLTLENIRLKRLEAEEREGKLIEIDIVTAINNRIFGELRAGIISLSSQIQTLSIDQRTQLDNAIDDILRDISKHQIDGAEDSESIAA